MNANVPEISAKPRLQERPRRWVKRPPWRTQSLIDQGLSFCRLFSIRLCSRLPVNLSPAVVFALARRLAFAVALDRGSARLSAYGHALVWLCHPHYLFGHSVGFLLRWIARLADREFWL